MDEWPAWVPAQPHHIKLIYFKLNTQTHNTHSITIWHTHLFFPRLHFSLEWLNICYESNCIWRASCFNWLLLQFTPRLWWKHFSVSIYFNRLTDYFNYCMNLNKFTHQAYGSEFFIRNILAVKHLYLIFQLIYNWLILTHDWIPFPAK